MIDSPFTDAERTHINLVKARMADLLKEKFDELAFPMIVKNMFLSGGAIATALQGKMPNDFDIYCKNDKQVLAISSYYRLNSEKVADVNENYQEYLGKDGKMITTHAITMANKIQFITNRFGTPEEIRNDFDYMHCKPYLDFDTGLLHISKQQYDACVQKRLVVNNPEVITIRRRDKFVERGYYI